MKILLQFLSMMFLVLSTHFSFAQMCDPTPGLTHTVPPSNLVLSHDPDVQIGGEVAHVYANNYPTPSTSLTFSKGQMIESTLFKIYQQHVRQRDTDGPCKEVNKLKANFQ